MNKILGFAGQHWVLTTFLVLVVGAAAWWHFAFPSATWRYKMTVTVETPEGLKTGSAVREVYGSAEPGFYGVEAKVHYTVKGEAVVVDLGGNRVLFYTMGTDDSYRVLSCAYGMDVHSFEAIKYYPKLKGTPTSLIDKKCVSSPFVTFKDIKDPKTVSLAYEAHHEGVSGQAVPSYIVTDNMEQLFGNGVKLKDVTIEMTDEDVTWGVDKYLGQLHAVGPYEFVEGVSK